MGQVVFVCVRAIPMIEVNKKIKKATFSYRPPVTLENVFVTVWLVRFESPIKIQASFANWASIPTRITKNDQWTSANKIWHQFLSSVQIWGDLPLTQHCIDCNLQYSSKCHFSSELRYVKYFIQSKNFKPTLTPKNERNWHWNKRDLFREPIMIIILETLTFSPTTPS